jgi:hypothetical protein
VANATPGELEVTPTEVPWGESRRCEYGFESNDQNGDTPWWRGDFAVMASPIALVSWLPQRDRRPLAGAGPEMFEAHKMGGRIYYVMKGKYAASLANFPRTFDPSTESHDSDAGHVALLRRIAERLP